MIVKAIQDAEGDVLSSPRFQEILERHSKEPASDTVVEAPDTSKPAPESYPQSVVLYHLFLILREVCRQKGQDASAGPSRLLSLLTDSYSLAEDPDRSLLKDILLS